MKANVTTEREVLAVLQRLAQGYAKRNLKEVMECFAADADVMMYGTGADEKRIGATQVQAQVERDWAQSESTEMTFGWTSVSAAGLVSWVAADCEFTVRRVQSNDNVTEG